MMKNWKFCYSCNNWRYCSSLPGKFIPADLRLIEAKDMEVNQSTLTGEAKTVFKTNEALKNEPKSAINLTT